MNDKIKTGKNGENLAARFLESQGFTVVARNYRHKHAEIDLIVQKDDWMIFVEVKTRASSTFGEPEAFVSKRQAQKIYEAAEEFIYSRKWPGHIRFDIISVKTGEKPEITHFVDAITY